jgi:hypothetical protein
MKKTKAKQIVKEQIKSLYEKDLNAKKKPAPEEIEDTEEETTDGGEMEMSGGGDVEGIQQNLQDAFNASKGLGDEKLAQQIANTITYFTRSHVLKAGVTEESNSIRRMQELAGIDNEDIPPPPPDENDHKLGLEEEDEMTEVITAAPDDEVTRLRDRVEELEVALANMTDAFMAHTQWTGQPPYEVENARAILNKPTNTTSTSGRKR